MKTEGKLDLCAGTCGWFSAEVLTKPPPPKGDLATGKTRFLIFSLE